MYFSFALIQQIHSFIITHILKDALLEYFLHTLHLFKILPQIILLNIPNLWMLPSQFLQIRKMIIPHCLHHPHNPLIEFLSPLDLLLIIWANFTQKLYIFTVILFNFSQIFKEGGDKGGKGGKGARRGGFWKWLFCSCCWVPYHVQALTGHLDRASWTIVYYLVLELENKSWGNFGMIIARVWRRNWLF